MEYRKWHSEYIANFRQNLDNFSDVLIEENENMNNQDYGT